MKMNQVPGINIQFPWSKLILSGKKTIETRTYPLPPKHINRDLALIETPGSAGKFSARIVAIVRFGESFEYKSKSEFFQDKGEHLVGDDDVFSWPKTGKKWGWPILSVKPLKRPLPAPRPRGIVFCSRCEIPSTLLAYEPVGPQSLQEN